MLRSALTTLVPALLATATVAGATQLQSTVVTSLGGTEFNTSATFAVPFPGGGALACYNGSVNDFGPGEVTLVRVDESGAELWRRSEAVETRLGLMDALLITPGGSILLNTQHDGTVNMAEGSLLSIDADGNTEWEMWPTSASNGRFQGRVAGFSPGGDIYLVGMTRGSDLVSALLIDASTGTEIWRVDRPGLSTNAFLPELRANSADGDLYLAYTIDSDYGALRIDPSGQIVYDRPDLGLSSFRPILRSIHALPGGELSLAFSSLPSAAGYISNLARLDPTGALRWEESDATPTETVATIVMEDGSVIAAYRRPGGLLRRVDANGAQLWQRLGPPGTNRITGLAANDDGTFSIAYSTSPSVGAAVARYSANGALLTSFELEPNSAQARVQNAVVAASDARGNTWVTYVSRSPVDVAIARLTVDAAAEAVECSQGTPNSTGQLGTLLAVGSPVAADGNLALVAESLPAGQTVLFLNARQSGFTANPGGSAGDLCLGSPLARYTDDLRTSNAAGRAVLQLDLAKTPEGLGSAPILAGETWFFQVWHRDVPAGSNLTSAVSVTFQ